MSVVTADDLTLEGLKKFLVLPDINDSLSIVSFNLKLSSLFSLALLICTCVVATTANAGFNIVLTALLNIGVIVGAFYSFFLKSSKSPIAFGFLLGSLGMLSIINLESAVYWGNLSSCKVITYPQIHQYSCTHRDAYAAVCSFCSLLLVSHVSLIICLWKNRASFIDESGVYDSEDVTVELNRH